MRQHCPPDRSKRLNAHRHQSDNPSQKNLTRSLNSGKVKSIARIASMRNSRGYSKSANSKLLEPSKKLNCKPSENLKSNKDVWPNNSKESRKPS